MNKGIDLNSLNIRARLSKFAKTYSKHAVFVAVLLVLLMYIFVVFKINDLSKAEPSASQTSNAANLIPKVNQKAISQIQSLEQSNTQVHSIFEQARNNPFQE